MVKGLKAENVPIDLIAKYTGGTTAGGFVKPPKNDIVISGTGS
jgi:hypothetical protein